MEFNQAVTDDYQSLHMRHKKMFFNAGYELPAIIYWNLRPKTTSFPATIDTPGVAMLSGFSSDLLKLFMERIELTPMSMHHIRLQTILFCSVASLICVAYRYYVICTTTICGGD
jgi:hypothetical protein